MSRKPRKGEDVNETAFRVVQDATGEPVLDPAIGTHQPPPEKNPAAVALGRLGGKVGGRVRAERLTEDRKREIASKAAKARWAKEAERSAKDEEP